MLDIDTGLRMLSLIDKHDALPLFTNICLVGLYACMCCQKRLELGNHAVTVVQYFYTIQV